VWGGAVSEELRCKGNAHGVWNLLGSNLSCAMYKGMTWCRLFYWSEPQFPYL